MEKDVKEILRELVAIPYWFVGQSVPNKQLVDYFKEAFKGCDFAEIPSRMTNDPAENAKYNNLVIGLNCKLENLERAIVLAGHMDTVPPFKPYEAGEDEITFADTTMKQDGDKLYGRGTVDMRGFFASVITKLDELKKMNVPVLMSITCDEEAFKMDGAKDIMKFFKEKNIKPQTIILGEPRSSTVSTSHSGFPDNQSDRLMGIVKRQGLELFPKGVGATEARVYSEYCPDTIVFGPGERNMCHTPNEHISLDELTKFGDKLMGLVNEIEKNKEPIVFKTIDYAAIAEKYKKQKQEEDIQER